MAKSSKPNDQAVPVEPNPEIVEEQTPELSESEAAAKLKKEKKVSQVWRCPATGFWLHDRDYAALYARKNNITLKEF